MMHPARMQLPFPITGPPTAQFSPVQASAASLLPLQRLQLLLQPCLALVPVLTHGRY